jgi:hypothetical protein
MSATPDAMEFELLTIGYTCRLVQKIFGQDRTPEKDKLVMKILNLATNYFKVNISFYRRNQNLPFNKPAAVFSLIYFAFA